MKRQCVASMRPRAGHRDNPLIIHVPGPEWLERYCRQVPQMAYDLAEAFWPGPLTMILSRDPVGAGPHHWWAKHRGGPLPRSPGYAGDYCRRRHTCCRAQCQSFRAAQLHQCAGCAGGYGGEDSGHCRWRAMSGRGGVHHFGPDGDAPAGCCGPVECQWKRLRLWWGRSP